MSRDGKYFVAAIAKQDGKPTVEGVQVGDRLLQIDALHIDDATKSEIFSALRGSPGELRTPLPVREGKQVAVRAKVTAF